MTSNCLGLQAFIVDDTYHARSESRWRAVGALLRTDVAVGRDPAHTRLCETYILTWFEETHGDREGCGTHVSDHPLVRSTPALPLSFHVVNLRE